MNRASRLRLRHLVVGVLAVTLGLVTASPGLADGGQHGKRVKVTPKNMKGWAFAQETPSGAGMMVHGPSRPPLGKGSAQLQVDSTGGWILGKAAYQGTPLRDVSQLSYWTYRQSGAPVLAIALQFNVDRDLTDGDESYQGRLVYEPYFTKTVLTGVWQRWNTQDDAQPGNWWFTKAPQNAPVTGCSQADPCTWSEVLTKFPNAGVHRTFGAVILKAGGGWVGGFVGNADALAIGVRGRTTVFDFEPRGGHHHDDDDSDDSDDSSDD